MARMIPSVLDRNANVPPGETKMFDLLRDDTPDDWIVLHSVDVPKHVRAIEGEADFVILVPGGGVVCLEVKSHMSVRRDANGWWHLGADDPQLRGPFKQSKEAMHSLRNRFMADDKLRNVPFVSAVAFPRCNFQVTSTEWEPWQVFDERHLRDHGVEAAIRRITDCFRKHLGEAKSARWFRPEDAMPTEAQCEQIVRAIRPAFEQHRSPKARREEAAGEIRRYTEEQFAAIDAMEDNRRVAFNGGAGTGKTFLALEAARRIALEEKPVALLCFNSLLGQWLQREAEPLGESIVHAGTFHSLLLSIANVDVPKENRRRFFEKELPNLALEALLNDHSMASSIDTLIIDEAQDLCKEPILDVLDLLVDGGFRNGNVLAFGDFDHQDIFEGGGLDLLTNKAKGDFSRYKLKVNCRNLPRVGELLAAAASQGNPYSSFRRSDDGYNVELKFYRSETEQREVLAAAIDLLRDEGLQLGHISILSTKADGVASLLEDPYRQQLDKATPRPGPKMRSTTIHAFKGLESPAVIATDFDSLATPEQRDLLYTAVSRSTERVVVLLEESVKGDLQQLIIGGNQ